MLHEIQQHHENPEDLPFISGHVKTYLQAHFNAGYQLQIGTLDYLKSKGHSEQFALGYLAGFQAVCEYLDMVERNKKEQTEED